MIDDDFDPIEWAAPVYDAGYAFPELYGAALLLLGAVVVAAALGIAIIRRVTNE